MRRGVTPTNQTLGLVARPFPDFAERLMAHDLRCACLAGKVDAFEMFSTGGVECAWLGDVVHAVGDGDPVVVGSMGM